MKSKILLVLVWFFCLPIGCKKDKDPTPPATNTPTVKKTAMIDLLCKEWVHKEAYKNGDLIADNGTEKHRFTKSGKLQIETNLVWIEAGTFRVTGTDSMTLEVKYNNVAQPGIWQISTLNETDFIASFDFFGDEYEYRYKR